MVAKNMKELEAMIMKEMRKSMHVASEKMLADMYEETGGFYTIKESKKYVRTGALGDTPKTTALTVSNKSVSYDAYLDTTHNYTTGQNPNMKDILELASEDNHSSSVGYLRSTKGSLKPWNDIEQNLKVTLDNTLSKFFTKLN